MPPRKRQRLSPPEESATPAAATPREVPSKRSGPRAPSPEELVNDPWTDEQNTALMKGLIKWKPVGMHKHFRMISLANYLHSHGHEAEHTRIPGIWAKLDTLYNMKTLDEREDGYGDSLLRGSSEERSTPSSSATDQSGGSDGGTGGGGSGSKRDAPYFPFQLPDDPSLRARAFDKRLDDEAPSSPPALKHQLGTSGTEPAIAESFSLLDTEGYKEEAGSSRASTPVSTRGAGRGRGRGRGGRAEAGRRAAKPKEESVPTRGGGRGTRGRPKKEAAESTEEEEEEKEEEEDEEEEDASEEDESGEEGEEDDGDDDEDDGDDSSEKEEEEEEAPKPRPGPTRGRGRGRGGRGRGRGRRG